MGYGYSVADGAKTIMLEPYEDLPAYDAYEDAADAVFDREEAWDEMEETIRAALSTAFKWRDRKGREWRKGHPSGMVIADSALFDVLLEEDQGGYGYAFLSILPRQSVTDPYHYGYFQPTKMEGIARHLLPKVANSLFDRLAGQYELRIPGGYTSSPYRPKIAA